MDSAANKKRVERIYVEEARRSAQWFPEGDLIMHEGPDFLLHAPRGTIGIEVSELCREAPRAERRRLAVVPRRAKQRYARIVDDPVDVVVVFAPHADEILVEDATRELAAFVQAHHHEKGKNFEHDLPASYAHIGIFPPHGDPMGRWQHMRAFNVKVAPQELIAFRIAEKNKRVDSYRQSADTVWLLLVNDRFLGPGEVFVRPEDLAGWAFPSAFDKVLVFLRDPGGMGDVIALRTVPAREPVRRIPGRHGPLGSSTWN